MNPCLWLSVVIWTSWAIIPTSCDRSNCVCTTQWIKHLLISTTSNNNKKKHIQVLKDVWWHVPRVKITSPALTAHIKHTARIEIKRTRTSYCQQHVCRAPISSSWPPTMYASVWLDREREREDTVKGCNKRGAMHVHISRTRRELEGRLYMDIIWQVRDTISATKTSSIPFPRTSSLPTILCRVSYVGVMIHRSGSVNQFNDW